MKRLNETPMFKKRIGGKKNEITLPKPARNDNATRVAMRRFQKSVQKVVRMLNGDVTATELVVQMDDVKGQLDIVMSSLARQVKR